MNLTTQITNTDVSNLAQAIVTAAQKFYEDPENVRKFEEWKRQKQANQ